MNIQIFGIFEGIRPEMLIFQASEVEMVGTYDRLTTKPLMHYFST